MPLTYITIENLAIAIAVVGIASIWEMGLFNVENGKGYE
jgi:hypothetical protein